MMIARVIPWWRPQVGAASSSPQRPVIGTMCWPAAGMSMWDTNTRSSCLGLRKVKMPTRQQILSGISRHIIDAGSSWTRRMTEATQSVAVQITVNSLRTNFAVGTSATTNTTTATYSRRGNCRMEYGWVCATQTAGCRITTTSSNTNYTVPKNRFSFSETQSGHFLQSSLWNRWQNI